MKKILFSFLLFSGTCVYSQTCTDVPAFKQGTFEKAYSTADGNYQVSLIIFNDGVQGKLFKGGMSGRYYTENAFGVNT
jgi:hypothetical protein